MTTKKCVVSLYGQQASLLVTQTKYRYEVRFEDCGTEIGHLKHADYGTAWLLRCTDFRRRTLKGKALHVEEAFDQLCRASLLVPLGVATPRVLMHLGEREGLNKSLDPKIRSYFDEPTVVGRHAVLKRLQEKFTHADVSNPKQLVGLRLHHFV